MASEKTLQEKWSDEQSTFSIDHDDNISNSVVKELLVSDHTNVYQFDTESSMYKLVKVSDDDKTKLPEEVDTAGLLTLLNKDFNILVVSTKGSIIRKSF